MRSADALGFHQREIAMTRIAATSGSVATLDTIFSTVVASCAEYCAGARQGRDIEARYRTLSRRSSPDLARLGMIRTDVARAALNDICD
jgi:hypothetical protein